VTREGRPVRRGDRHRQAMPTEISGNGGPQVEGGRRHPTSSEEEGERFGAGRAAVLAGEKSRCR
jgi:hypothetical protein